MNAGNLQSKIKKLGAGIATPMGSDMSRAKFDFSGYDPAAMRKPKEIIPDRKVIKKVEEDMEVFITDTREDPDAVDLEKRNKQSSQATKDVIEKEIFQYSAQTEITVADKRANMERMMEIQSF